MPEPTADPDALLERARAGDAAALGALLEAQRPQLEAAARARLAGRLLGKLDPADVVQETFLEAHRDVPTLRYLAGLSFPEVAARMGRSLDSVEKLWVRALARIRTALGDES